ncbi:MAG: hypothetical protein ACKV1O_27155 [Saprospiraceae bacterium]
MKNVKTALLLVFGYLALMTSCKDNYEQLLKKTEVNPLFETAPPIASNLSFEILEEPTNQGENIRFIAHFRQGQIEGQYLALLLDDKKVLLRDDGKGADKTANDNQFSIFIKDDLEQVRSELLNRKELAIASDSIPIFNNRSVRFINSDKLKEINFRELGKGKIFDIPLELVFGAKGLSDQKKTLMITDLGVVEDPTRTFNPCTRSGNPNGVWTFGELMR